MKKYISLLALSLIVPSSFCNAISNIENERPDLPAEGFSGSVSIGLAGKSGNQEEESYEGGLKVTYRHQDEIVMLLLVHEYGSVNEIKNNDNSFAHFRWTHLLTDRWATEAFAQWEADEFSYLTSRTLAGGGGRYILAQKPKFYTLAVGLGAFAEREINDLVTYEETQELWRINSYYSYKLNFNDRLSLINTLYFQPNTEDTGDYRLLFDFGISNKLTENLALALNYRVKHDSQPTQNLAAVPPVINHKTNTEYKTTISYRF